MEDMANMEHKEITSTTIHDITYTKVQFSEFEKCPEMYLLYYDYIKNMPHKVDDSYEGFKAYLEKLKKNEYYLVTAYKRGDFCGVVYCIYEDFTDYVFIKQAVVAPHRLFNMEDLASAIWRFEITAEKPTKGVMHFGIEELSTFELANV